jgi:hypothetical protein
MYGGTAVPGGACPGTPRDGLIVPHRGITEGEIVHASLRGGTRLHVEVEDKDDVKIKDKIEIASKI